MNANFAKDANVYLDLLSTVGGIIQHGMVAYAQIREEAGKNGVPEADLTASDIRWLRRRPDPLKGQDAPPAVIPPTNNFELNDYNRDLDTMPDVTKLVKGDIVAQKPNGKYFVGMHGIGFPGQVPVGWVQLWPEVETPPIIVPPATEVPPPEVPPTTVPNPPLAFAYDTWVDDPGNGPLANGDYVYARALGADDDPYKGKVYVHCGGPVTFGFNGLGSTIRVVTK